MTPFQDPNHTRMTPQLNPSNIFQYRCLQKEEKKSADRADRKPADERKGGIGYRCKMKRVKNLSLRWI
ncbi:hypothetical protein OIDMADRAFT_19803 [Oidiodendron maius Zn]|uniref:Uncharacterized protein n=1 Tax=Oidiodendron maius (strain Zn) TaxID=913774 RepID=A0A0C3H9D8_OIDMZ|nr:hypothetical protein OIDMADRAFT_19803 [Oidiodendron maius Zn]